MDRDSLERLREGSEARVWLLGGLTLAPFGCGGGTTGSRSQVSPDVEGFKPRKVLFWLKATLNPAVALYMEGSTCLGISWFT